MNHNTVDALDRALLAALAADLDHPSPVVDAAMELEILFGHRWPKETRVKVLGILKRLHGGHEIVGRVPPVLLGQGVYAREWPRGGA